MIDKYTSLNDAIYQDSRVADILMSYGVPCIIYLEIYFNSF